MSKPGISRAFSGAIIGFIAGALIVLGLRILQGLEPAWDPAVALILATFTTIAGWLWGLGAFDPRMSAHGDHHTDEHAIVTADSHVEEEYTSSSFGLMMSQLWRALAFALVVLIGFYSLAALPTGLFLQTTNEAEGNVGAFATGVVLELPFVGTVETTQMALFFAFIAFTVVSLAIFAGGLGFLFYKGSEQVAIARASEPDKTQLIPPAPVRALGRGAKSAARSLKNGLPKVLGSK